MIAWRVFDGYLNAYIVFKGKNEAKVYIEEECGYCKGNPQKPEKMVITKAKWAKLEDL